MKRFAISIFMTAAALVFAVPVPAGSEILAAIDANTRFSSIVYLGKMEISNGGETRVKTMQAWAVGEKKAFVEFTNPEDFGVRYLKIEKDMWIYFPDEQDTVKISGHLLKEGIMGSDVSYEDALESSSLLDKYTAEVSGPQEFSGRNTWILTLKAKAKTAPYDMRKMWIDSERYIPLKEEMYAKSGKLLKTSVSSEFIKVGGKWVASRVEMENKLRKNTKTVMTLAKIEVNIPIDEKKFSLKELSK